MLTNKLLGGLCAAAMLLGVASNAWSGLINVPGLVNTGVPGVGSVDLSYTPIGTPTGPAAAFGLAGAPGWVAAPAGSEWIGVRGGDQGAAAGTYIYSLTLDLTGFSQQMLDTLTISGQWATDNNATMFLNGFVTSTPAFGFNTLADFTIDSGFTSGINTLFFRVDNIINDSPSGILVTNLTAVPEPAVLALLGIGLVGIGAVRFRKR